jgi:hypothetical protein
MERAGPEANLSRAHEHHSATRSFATGRGHPRLHTLESFSFLTLFALEQRNKSDPRPNGQKIAKGAHDAADGNEEAKTDGEHRRTDQTAGHCGHVFPRSYTPLRGRPRSRCLRQHVDWLGESSYHASPVPKLETVEIGFPLKEQLMGFVLSFFVRKARKFLDGRDMSGSHKKQRMNGTPHCRGSSRVTFARGKARWLSVIG